jgi:hypothetical protein
MGEQAAAGEWASKWLQMMGEQRMSCCASRAVAKEALREAGFLAD